MFLTKQQLKKITGEAMGSLKYLPAIKLFESCLVGYKNDEKFLCNLGLLYDHQAMLEKKQKSRTNYEKKALAFYKKILKRKPKSRCALNGVARIFWHRGDKKAIKYYKKVLNLSPPSEKGVALFHLGNAYNALGENERAIKIYERSLKKVKVGFPVLIHLIRAYILINNLKEAEKYFNLLTKEVKKIGNEKVKKLVLQEITHLRKKIKKRAAGIKFKPAAIEGISLHHNPTLF